MLSTSLIHVFKGHQIAIRQVRFHF